MKQFYIRISNASHNVLWYILMALAFVAITTYAAHYAMWVEAEAEAEKAERAREKLKSIVEVWEGGVLSRASSWLDEIAFDENIETTQAKYRESTEWFDAFYVWEEDRINFPIKSPQFTPPSQSDPCTLAPETFNFTPCLTKSKSLQNEVSIVLAETQLALQNPIEARNTLTAAKPPIHSGIKEFIKNNVNIETALKRKRLAFKTAQAGAPPLLNSDHYRDIAIELSRLDAPILKSVLPFLNERLQEKPIRSPEITSHISRAQRRLHAFEEINDKMLQADLPNDQNIHIRSDPYSDRPFLVLHRRHSKSNRHLAVQLDPPNLLSDVFSSVETSSNQRLVLLDADDKVLADQFQALDENEEIWVQTPCGRLFPHLRAAYIKQKTTQSFIDMRSIPLFIPIILAAALALLAMMGRISADKRQKEFVERQQAFIARVSHELKTPLAGIRLMAESIQMGIIRSPEQALQFTERILNETDRLEKRIDEVLQASRKAELQQRELIDGNLLLKSLHKHWAPIFSENNGILRLELDGDSDFFGDPHLVTDALTNLLTNAIKYKKAETMLRCIIRSTVYNRSVEFTITDNGMGVPISHRKRIFERFVRIEEPNRGLSGGHGLGLAFVEETMKAHRGSVKCVDGMDGGASFILRFPKH